MKDVLSVLVVGILLLPICGRADDNPLAEKAQQVFQLFQAIGGAAGTVLSKPEVVDMNDPMAQQFLSQFRPILQSELHFVRVVCQPTPEQYKTIKAAGEVGLNKVVTQFATTQRKMEQGRMGAGQSPEFPEPRAAIANSIIASVNRTLPAEKGARYHRELTKRAAARKRALVLNLVAKLDNDLVLSPDQREKMIEVLNKHVTDTSVKQLEVLFYGPEYFPAVPDQAITPLLTAKQLDTWKGTARGQSTIWGWFGVGFVRLVDIGEEEDIPAQPNLEQERAGKDVTLPQKDGSM
jgi:hypothetical protein